jgi:hypothetical protein
MPFGLRVLLVVCTNERFDDFGIEAALDRLDALVQRLDGVAGEDRDGLLGQDRAVVDPSSATCTVTPVTLAPYSSVSRTACQPLNAGSSAGCVLTMRPGYASCTGFSRIVPKPAMTTRSTS